MATASDDPFFFAHTKQKGEYPLERIITTSIIPVDINTFLYRMERNMARLHDYLLARQMVRLLQITNTSLD